MGGQVIAGQKIQIRSKGATLSLGGVPLDFEVEIVRVADEGHLIELTAVEPVQPWCMLFIPNHYSKRKIKQAIIKDNFERKKRHALRGCKKALGQDSTAREVGVSQSDLGTRRAYVR
jgi:hypothetical protein